MPNGQYFQAYLNELGNRRATEAHEFATQQMINQQVFNTIGQSIQGIGQQVHDAQIKQNQYEYVAEATGLFDPKQYQVKTPTEVKLEGSLAQQKAQADSIRDEMTKQMKATSQPLGNVGQPQTQIGTQESVTTPEQDIKMNLNRRLDKLQQTYKDSSAKADALALNLQTYKNSDQYATDVKTGAFKQFSTLHPLYSSTYFDAYDRYQNQLQQNRLDTKYQSQTHGNPEKDLTTAKREALNQIASKEKEISASNPVMTTEQQAKHNQALSDLYGKLKNANSLDEVSNTAIGGMNQLEQFKQMEHPVKQEQPKKQGLVQKTISTIQDKLKAKKQPENQGLTQKDIDLFNQLGQKHAK